MISAEDDHGTTQLVNHTKAVAALLVGLGVLLVAVIAGLARYSTAFEVITSLIYLSI